MKLRMANGWGYMRKRIANGLWHFEDGERWVELDGDFGYGDPVRIARWGDQDVWLHRYTYGERVCGYPRAALQLTAGHI